MGDRLARSLGPHGEREISHAVPPFGSAAASTALSTTLSALASIA
jgi:hypothetical protein